MSDKLHLEYGEDGRMQESFAHGNFTDPARWGNTILMVGTVLVVRFPEESGNRFTGEITYDLVLHSIRKRINNVPRLMLKGGTKDGDEHVLYPSFTSNAASNSYNPMLAGPDKLDGDRVLVGFVEGNSRAPVIIGAMQRWDNTYKGSAEKGQRRFMQHKKTTVEIDKDGNVVAVLHPGATFTLASPSAKLEVPITRSTGDINVDGNVSVGGGATGSFVDAFGKLITVQDGIVVKIT